MNRGLRARHRRLTRGIAILLPLLFVIAVSARQEPVQMSALPGVLDPSPSQPGKAVLRWESRELLQRLPAEVRVYDASGPQFGGAVEIAPIEDPRRPDVIVYWSSDSEIREVVPADSHLLGRLAGVQLRRFLLPPAAATQPGSLYFYSLGHQELVDAAALKAQP